MTEVGLATYIEGATRHGATFLKRNVVKLLTRDAKVIGVQFTRGHIHAEQTIIASGAWASQQGTWLGVEIPIRPQRGQLVTVGITEPKLSHIVIWQDIYLAPKCDQTTTIGASNDYAGYTQVPTAKGVLSPLSQGSEAVPSLGCGAFVGAKAGLRAKTPDKLPIIEPIPGWEGISIAAGHNSNGLLFSSLTGQCIVAQLMRTPVPIKASALRLARFAQ